MTPRFARDAKDLVVRARAHAGALGHSQVSGRHLLLGAVALADTDLERVLVDHGVTVAELEGLPARRHEDQRADPDALVL